MALTGSIEEGTLGVLLTFLIIGGVGILLLVAALVLGDLMDGMFDFGGDMLSGAALAGFLGAFGFVGAIIVDGTDNVTFAMLGGIAAGLIIGAGVGWATLQLKKGGDESNVRTTDLVGRDASVSNAIPEGGFGQVSIVVAGHVTRLNARSQTALPAGSPVTITGVLSPTSVMVEPRS